LDVHFILFAGTIVSFRRVRFLRESQTSVWNSMHQPNFNFLVLEFEYLKSVL